MAERITQSEYAGRRGWSRQNVHKYVKAGLIPLHDGRIDPEEADAILSAYRNPAQARDSRGGLAVIDGGRRDPKARGRRGGGGGDGDGQDGETAEMDFFAAREAREILKLEREQFDFDIEKRRYIDTDKAVRGLSEIVKLLVAKLDPLAAVLERDCGIPPAAVIRAQQEVDAFREEAYQALSRLRDEWREAGV